MPTSGVVSRADGDRAHKAIRRQQTQRLAHTVSRVKVSPGFRKSEVRTGFDGATNTERRIGRRAFEPKVTTKFGV